MLNMWRRLGLRLLLLSGLLTVSSASMALLGGFTFYAPTPPTPTVTLTETQSTDGNWVVSWSASSDAIRYETEESAGGAWGNVYSGSGRSTAISGKRVNGSYYYRVRACSVYTCSDWSTAKEVRLNYITPSTLSGLPATSSTGNVTLTWSIPAFATHTARLQRKIGGGAWADITSRGRGTSKAQNNLGANSYQYRLVRTITYSGCYDGGFFGFCLPYDVDQSETAKVVQVTPPQTPPSISLPSSSTGSYTVSWGAASGNPATGYQVQQSINGGGYGNQYFGAVRSKAYTVVPASYRYRVRACRGAWNNASCSGWRYSITTQVNMTTPSKPTLGSKSALSDGAFTVAWGSVKNANKYNLYRDTAPYKSGSYSSSLVYSGTARSISQNLGDGNYQYRITACYGSRCSAKSTALSTQVLFKPATPTNVRITNKSSQKDTSYNVAWNGQSRRVTQYTLYRDKAPFGSSSFVAQTTATTTGLSIAKADGDGVYRYRVKACNEAGCSGLSGYVTTSVLGLPAVPASVRITSKSSLADTSYSLAWDGQSRRVSHYEVLYSQASYTGSYGGESKVSTSALLLNYTKGDGKYRYRVRACNESGCSAYTGFKEASILAKPTVPSNLRVTDKTSQVDGSYRLVWNTQSRRVTEYRLYRERRNFSSGNYTADGSQTTNTLNISKTDSDGDYRYRVKACNEAGCSGLSAYVATSVLAKPVTPANVRMLNKSNASDTSYTIAWNTQSGRVTQYKLYRDKASYGSNQYQSDATVSTTALTSNRADNDGQYRYRVEACNESGCSAKSAFIYATVLKKPARPSVPSVPSQSLGAFNAALTYTSGIVQSIRLQQSVNGGAWINAPVYSYNGKPISLALTRSAYVSDGSDTLANYRLRIAACNSSGCSGYSSPSNSISVVPPGTPAGFVSNASHGNTDSDGNFTLRWVDIPDVVSAGVTFNIKYEAQVSSNTGSSWQVLVANTVNPNHAINNLGAGDYQYRVRACLNTVGCGAWTHTLSIKVAYTPADVGSINTPATSANGSYTISWSKPSGVVTHYQLNINGTLRSAPINTTSFAVTNESDGSINYRVRACNTSVCSAFSPVRATQVLRTPTVPLSIGGDVKSNANGYYWLRWSKPTQGRVDFYQIKTSDVPNNTWANAINNGKNIERSFTKTDGGYTYQVRACNRFSNNTLNCGPSTATHNVTVLNKPKAVAAPSLPTQSLDGNYTLAWQQPASTVDSYQVRENGSVIASAYTSLNFPLAGRSDGLYHYQVKACNTAGCGVYSSEVTIRVLNTPSAVVNLGGDAVSDGTGKFQLHWKKPTKGQVLRYEIRSSKAPNNTWASSINNSLNLQRNFTRTEGDYSYWVRACNELSCGPTRRRNIEVRIAPTSPKTISGEGVNTSGDYTLSWSTASGTVSHYELQQASSGGNDWHTAYNGTAKQYRFTAMSAGSYDYRLKACNESNCGAWSDYKTVEVDRYTLPTPPVPQATTTPSVPTGADSIGSLEGQFRINESGAASYSVSIATAAGTAGVAPELGVNYNSQGGNGLLGKGWNLSGLSAITRCRQSVLQEGEARPITWSSDDRFCLDGQRLLLVSGSAYGAVGAVYNTEIDSFSTIAATGGSEGHPTYFVVERKDGSVSYLGETQNSRQSKGTQKTFGWLINRFEDSVGNGITFDYLNDIKGQRISKISYAYGEGSAAQASIEFSYEPRPDVLQAYIGGEQFVTHQRLNNISSYTQHNGSNTLLRQYRMGYDNSQEAAAYSYISDITECTENNTCLPATTFTWEPLNTDYGVQTDPSISLALGGNGYLMDSKFADINGDGLQDMIYVSGYAKLKKRFLKKPKLRSHQTVHYLINTGNGFVSGDAVRYSDSVEHPLRLQVIDYNADSHQDLLVFHGDQWELYVAVASGDGHWALERSDLSMPFSERDIQLADINSDGLADAIDGNDYWLLERDSSEPVSSNNAYHFGVKQSVQYSDDFERDYRAWLAEDIFPLMMLDGCAADCAYYDPSKLSAKVNMGDLNGDGISDFLTQYMGYQFALSHQTSTGLEYRPLNGDHIPTIADHELVRPADINGDGLIDIVYWQAPQYEHVPFFFGGVSGGLLEQGRWQVQLNTGAGFAAAIPLFEAATGDVAEDQAVQVADINRDGFADIVHQADNTLYVRYWQAATQTFSADKTLKANITINDKTNHIVMDYNGDGVSDYIRFSGQSHGGSFSFSSSGDSASGLWDAKRNVAQVISRIENGLGAVTELEYEHLNQSEHYAPIEPEVSGCEWTCVGDYTNDHSVYNAPFSDIPSDEQTLQATPLSPVLSLNGALPVVSRVRSSAPTGNNANAQSSIAYYYAGGRIQVGRGSLGFKQLRTVDEQTGVATTTTYRQDWPFVGSPWKTQVRTEAGHLLSESENIWALQGWQSSWPDTVKREGSAVLGPIQPFIASSIEQGYNLANNGSSQGSLLQTVTTTLNYDGYGNALSISSSTEDGSGAVVQQQTTTNGYGSSQYDQQKGRLAHTSVSTERPGQLTQTRSSQFSYYGSGDLKGLLQQEIIQPDGGESQRVVLAHYYDQHGNKTHTRSTAWDGQATSTRYSARAEYDSTGRYISNTYQHYPVLGERLSSQVIARNAYGSATVVADHLGNRAYSAYTPMGRNYFNSSDAGGWQLNWLGSADSLCPSGTAYTVYSKGADGSQSKQCMDVVGRTVRSLSQGFAGDWIARDTEFDALGRSHATSEPYYHNGGSAAYWTTVNQYDLLGRPVHITAPDGSTAQQQYNGLSTTHINALGHRKTDTHNVLGEVIQVTDNAGSVTYYRHDALGQLIGMTDSAGNSTTLVYDSLGRKTQMNDPDKGQWLYRYNAFGELISQTDAKGQISTLQYDSLGRKAQRSDRRSNGSVEQSTIWHYDSQTNGLGQLTSVSHSDGYQHAAYYDRLGRNHQSDTTLPSGVGTFTQSQTFDQLGRLYQQFDASSGQQSNEQRGLQTHYNAYGYAHKISNARYRNGAPTTVYQRIHNMNARGQVTSSTLGNGVHTYQGYNHATGLLEAINSERLDGVKVQDLQYDWDSVGNLNYRIEHSGNKDLREDFGYDGLNRLIRASVQTTDSQYEQTLSYNALGNITHKSDVGSYSYGQGAGPHAVTQAGNTVYHYDANGNNISSSDGRSLQYSSFDKVTQVNKGQHTTTFAYGPSRSRYQRTDTNSQTGETKTTHYLGSVELIDYTSGPRAGEREYKRQLGVAIETLLYKNNQLQQQNTQYLHRDHLGSIDVITDSIGLITQEMSFDAWGQRRNASDWEALSNNPLTLFDTSITTRGFTGHEMVDGVGIIHMNGRIYDPKLGRFLQADPFVPDATNAQSLNRYSYIHNNPLNATDPSGYFPWHLVIAAVVAYVAADIVVTVGINSGWDEDFIQAATIIATCWVSGCFSPESVGNLTWTEAAVIATLGGITSVLQGGKFGHGFAAAGITMGLGKLAGKAGLIAKGKVFSNIATKAVIGGTASAVTGGKFANGAAGAAFAAGLSEIASAANSGQVKGLKDYSGETRSGLQGRIGARTSGAESPQQSLTADQAVQSRVYGPPAIIETKSLPASAKASEAQPVVFLGPFRAGYAAGKQSIGRKSREQMVMRSGPSQEDVNRAQAVVLGGVAILSAPAWAPVVYSGSLAAGSVLRPLLHGQAKAYYFSAEAVFVTLDTAAFVGGGGVTSAYTVAGGATATAAVVIPVAATFSALSQ